MQLRSVSQVSQSFSIRTDSPTSQILGSQPPYPARANLNPKDGAANRFFNSHLLLSVSPPNCNGCSSVYFSFPFPSPTFPRQRLRNGWGNFAKVVANLGMIFAPISHPHTPSHKTVAHQSNRCLDSTFTFAFQPSQRNMQLLRGEPCLS